MVGTALFAAGVSPPEVQLKYFRNMVRKVEFHERQTGYETKRVIATLEAAHLDPVLLKGIAVSARAFGRLGLRENRDIDILVPTSTVEEVAYCMEEMGYKRTEPAPSATAAEMKIWYRRHKDVVYKHNSNRFVVEIHWRLFENPFLLPIPDDKGQTQVKILNRSFNVLPPLFEVIYLCVHGAHHAWSRLKWLADVSTILGGMGKEDIHFLLAEARRLKVDAALGQALLLSHYLLGISLEETLLKQLKHSRRLMRLFKIALISIAAGDGLELEQQFFGSTRKSVSHYLIKPEIRYWLAEAKYDLIDVSDNRLPPALRHFGLISRFLSWIWKRASMRRSLR